MLDTAAGRFLLRYNDPRRLARCMYSPAPTASSRCSPAPAATDALTGAYLFEQTRRRPARSNAGADGHAGGGRGQHLRQRSCSAPASPEPRGKPRFTDALRSGWCGGEGVLAEAIEAGGSTLRVFVNASGEPGYFQLDYFVYGRDGQACKRCGGGGLLKLMRHGGRRRCIARLPLSVDVVAVATAMERSGIEALSVANRFAPRFHFVASRATDNRGSIAHRDASASPLLHGGEDEFVQFADAFGGFGGALGRFEDGAVGEQC